ncbi:MAG TPA: hydroxyphenylacetyl-CoA thioesterase PaaI [Methanocella sp.]|jgi:acyl-CoA thioesterase
MDLKEFFKRDKFAARCGIELLEVSPGGAKVSMKVEEHHLNGLRTVHGGAIFTLADYTFAVACNSHGTVAVALNVNISFVKAAFPGMTLYAEAKEVSMSPKIGTYDIRVTNEKGDLIATFQGLAYRKKEKLEELV